MSYDYNLLIVINDNILDVKSISGMEGMLQRVEAVMHTVQSMS